MCVSVTMWIVAKFSPYVWREASPCPDCAMTCECSNLNYVESEVCEDSDSDASCPHETFVHDFLRRSSFTQDYHSVASSDSCSCNEDDSLAWSENDFSISNSFWFGVGSLMQQDSDLNMKVILWIAKLFLPFETTL